MIGYHTTLPDRAKSILELGLEAGRDDDHFDTYQLRTHPLYPICPVFVSLDAPWDLLSWTHNLQPEEMSVFEVDLTGLNLLPDIPSLGDEGLRFEKKGTRLPPKIHEYEKISWMDIYADIEGLISYNVLLEIKDHLIETTQTAAILQTISPNRLNLIQHPEYVLL